MKQRSIEHLVDKEEILNVGDAFKVKQFVPDQEISQKRLDPFILLHYNPQYYLAPSVHSRGVETHPHRGIETVSLVYQGELSHRDNHGGSGVIAQGDVQWMTAGSGVLHSEFHSNDFTALGGNFQMVQLWVNLPAKNKMTQPKYQNLDHDKIPHHYLADQQSYVRVIAGQYQTTQGVAETFSELNLLEANLIDQATVNFSYPENFNSALLVIKGKIKIGQQLVDQDQFVVYANDASDFSFTAVEGPAQVLVMSGKPLNEEIVAYGPFVMNSVEEIKQAYQDYRDGKFAN